MTALVPVDVAALVLLSFDDQIDALGAAYRGWRRVDTRMAWAFGCGLRAVRDNYSRGSGDWGRVLDKIGIDHQKARRFMRIAEHDSVQIERYSTVDAAYQALPRIRQPKALKAAPAPETPAPAPGPSDDPEVVIETVAVESGPDPADQREERLERLAIRTEDIDGPVVDGWSLKFDRQAVRECEHVSTINAQARTIAALKRKNSDQCDAALLLPPSPEVDAYLAKFWNVARKAA